MKNKIEKIELSNLIEKLISIFPLSENEINGFYIHLKGGFISQIAPIEENYPGHIIHGMAIGGVIYPQRDERETGISLKRMEDNKHFLGIVNSSTGSDAICGEINKWCLENSIYVRKGNRKNDYDETLKVPLINPKGYNIGIFNR